MKLSNVISRMSVVVSCLLFSTTLHSEVEQVCIDRFQANGAFPGDADCEVLSLVSRAGLGNYWCTGPRGEEIVAEYCGLTENEECQYEPATSQSTNTGSVSFNIEPGSAFVSPALLQLFLLSNAGLLAADGELDSAFIFAAIFGLSLPVVAASDDLSFVYSDFVTLSPGTGNVKYCP